MDEEKFQQVGLGLLPLPKDSRYFKITKLFGSIDLSQIPDEFIIDGALNLKIKNQGATQYCTAYAVTTTSESQEGVELDPLYQVKKIAQIRGEEDLLNGATLKDAAKSVIDIGSVGQGSEWSDAEAQKHRKKSYFMADGYKDTFDAIRAAMWQNRAQKCLVLTGADWRSEWTKAEGGTIPEQYGNNRYPHAFVVIGQKKDYLICHLSNGDAIGNGGRFYFPRSVVNKEFQYGNLLFLDLDPEKVKKEIWSIWRRILEWLRKKFK